jgi:ATP/maltotriose-dependent transcriptional regulator MalT/DNA-binding SARP family transcriptional activator
LSRTRLLDFLHENIQCKLLLLSASAGYGKTSLLVDFARDTDLPVCWYTLDASDQDPRTFLAYLVEAIRVQFPTFGQRTRTLLQQRGGPEEQLQGIVGVLVNELIEEIPQYLVIVLDDYHTLDSCKEVNQVVDNLVRYLPEHIHLIVSGRTVPSLSLTRLTAYGEVAAIGTVHLCFTTEEGQQLLDQNFALDLSQQEVRQLIDENEGWITGILLKAQAIRQGSMGVLTQTQAPQEHIYAYLADEVLNQLDADLQTFLKKASVPSQIDAAFCDDLLERNDSAQVLTFLEQQNLFLVPLKGGWYRFHDLFREFLGEQLRQDEAEYNRLYRRAARIWQERGEPIKAVELLLQVQAYEAAAAQIDAVISELFQKGRLRTLLRWTEILPQAIALQWPRLFLFQGRAYLVLGQTQQADASFEQAERLFAAGNDVTRWIQTVADRAALQRTQGAYPKALQMAREALAHSEGQNSSAAVDLHRTIGRCLHALGDLVGAEEHFRAAVEYSLRLDFPYNQALAYLDLGFCLRAQGRMEETEAAYRQALERSRAIGSPDITATILNNLAMGPFLRGQFEEALDLLRQALEQARTAHFPRLLALVQASLGDLYGDLGDYTNAQQSYEEGLQQAHRADHAALVVYLQEASGNLARRQGLLPQARIHLTEALATAGHSKRDRARIQVSLALLEAAEGRAALALDRFMKAVATLEQGEWRLELLRAHLAGSIIHQHLQREEEAQRSLHRAVVLAEEMGVIEPFLAENGAIRPILRQLPPADRSSFLQGVLERMETPAVRPKGPSPELTRPVLRILALGRGQVFRNQTEILIKDWGYRLPRELFFYLLFHAPVRKEQIGLVFWPERTAARINSAFHNALYQARRAVGDSFVLFVDGVYQWNPEVTYWCDVLEFQQLLEQVEDLSPTAHQAIPLLQQALALYRGDLLEGVRGDWCALAREQLARRYLQGLLQLGDLLLDQGHLPAAQEAYLRARQADSFCEEAYRGLMRCHAQAGEQAQAIRIYQECHRLLGEELNTEPSPETQLLYQTIAEGTRSPADAPGDHV